MPLSYIQKRNIEAVMVGIIRVNPSGINTRQLISAVYTSISNVVPNANRHHIAGMIAWIISSTSHHLTIRTPGYSVIA